MKNINGDIQQPHHDIDSSSEVDGGGGHKSISILERDQSYQQFQSDDFNVTHYTSNVLKISSIPTSLEKLSIGKREITQELNEKITSNYQDLFNQAINIKDFDQEMNELQVGLQNLESSIQHMKHEISEPYNIVNSQITQLKRVQDSCELLRVIIRYLQQVKKLKTHLHDGRDLSKAAQSIHEINQLKNEYDLKGIEIVDTQTEWINQCREQIIVTSSNLIMQGMNSQNQSEVASSLQVFYNLGILVEKVNQIINNITEKVTKSIKLMLNVNKLVIDQQQQQQQQHNQHQQQKQSIWTKIESVMDTLYTSCIQVIQLQRVLSKIRDPSTHKTLMDIIKSSNTSIPSTSNGGNTTVSGSQGESIINTFWKSITKVLETNLLVAAKSSTIIENTFILEYPKISRCFHDFAKRLQNYCDIQQGTAAAVGITQDDHHLLFKVIGVFEKGYLERSKSKMINVVASLFPQSASWSGRGTAPILPTSKQLVDLSRTIWSEIEVIVNDDTSLLCKVTRVVCDILDLFAGKIESLVQTGPAALELITGSRPTQAQLINCSLFNCTSQLLNSVQSLVSSHTSLPREAIQDIDRSLLRLRQSADYIQSPLIDIFLSGVEQIALKMHGEDWNIQATPQQKQCSDYIEHLQQHITHFHTFYLSKYQSSQLLSQSKRIAARILTVFLRHVSLLRPMSEKGTLRLANDLTHLEFSLTALVPEGIKEIGAPYQWMRNYRHFMFKDFTASSVQSSSPVDFHLLPLPIIPLIWESTTMSLDGWMNIH
ncbi:oligomeric Golgi complex component [Cavenderia fasciculata]|uniref:Conserved oligomeric Golgi complex subunit 5 n=1 Tax=Cavenderia fasciculata TaxID=261658 RepID=F4QFM1_CACFS|nr:oligomeric Golgi complex component [Cavenderia fasciculata]EGG13474.1 oligomeric Golgi complex component [Cavenderia fasciculata]|eukprot:XP_004350178.1 oligomeric Golgi complex component [Cavenderia fasciculata]